MELEWCLDVCFFRDLKRHIGVEGLQCHCPDLKGEALHSCGRIYFSHQISLPPDLYGQRFNHKP